MYRLDVLVPHIFIHCLILHNVYFDFPLGRKLGNISCHYLLTVNIFISD